MSNEERMQARLLERQDLLDSATRLLQSDERIVAAWLIGSLGRGNSDEWGDIDLWIAVQDETVEAVTAARYDFARKLGKLVLLEDAPQNAPLKGAFLTAMYAGTCGAHLVDIYWQPLSIAQRPSNTKLLFERVAVPISEPQSLLSDEERTERAVQQARFFWVMSAITAKAIARRKVWNVLQLVIPTWRALEQARWLVGERPTQPTYRDVPSFNPPVTTSDQLAVLRALTDEMSALMTRTPILRDAVDSTVVEQVRDLRSTVEKSVS